MAVITLGAGENANGGQPVFGNNTIFFNGSGSNESVLIGGGTQQIIGAFNQGGDTIRFSGASNQYTIRSNGGSIIIAGPNGTNVTIPAPQPGSTANISFSDNDFGLTSDVSGGRPTFNLTDTDAGSQPVVITPTPTPVPGPVTPPVQEGVTLNVTATDVTEGGVITYTFTLSSAQTTPVTINVATTGGTATPGTDYTPVSTAITFAAGQTTQFLTVQTIDDNVREGTESIVLQVSTPAGVTLSPDADLTADIFDNDAAVQRLTTGIDTLTGGPGDDRFVSDVQDGQYLTANDRISGGAGFDTIEVSQRDLIDADFTNVTSVEQLVTYGGDIQLGAEADEAGLVSIDTRTRVDAINALQSGSADETTLDMTVDSNADGIADFNNAVNVIMANSTADTVGLSLRSAQGSNIDTGGTFQPGTLVGGTIPAREGPIDTVLFFGQQVNGNTASEIRLTLTSNAVGNDNAFGTDGALAVAAQSEDATGALTGGVVRFDDEGTRFIAQTDQTTGVTARFDVRDIDGTQRGSFDAVLLGTSLSESFTANDALGFSGIFNGNVYINGGAGDDFITGGVGADTLVGGSGNDNLRGSDSEDGQVDTLLGGEGSDSYTIFNGAVRDIVRDTGSASDEDTLVVLGNNAIVDATFTNVSGIEVLDTDDQDAVLGTIAAAAGFRTANIGSGDLDASTFGRGLIVNSTTGSVTTGVGNDTVNIARATATGTDAINTGAGDDRVNLGYSFSGEVTSAINGGEGTDTLTIGGDLSVTGLIPGSTGSHVVTLGAGVVGFENLTILQPFYRLGAPVGSAVNFTVNTNDANVAAGGTLTVDASALTGVVTQLATATTPAVVGFSTLAFNGNAETNGRFDVTGGAGNDILGGGAGNDILRGGDGDDIINGFGGDDQIFGGAGNDTIGMSVTEFNRANSADTVDGGEGNDVLVLDSAAATETVNDGSFSGTRFTSIEEVRLQGTAAAATDTAFTFVAGQGLQSIGVRGVSVGLDATGSNVSLANFATTGGFLNDTIATGNSVTFTGSAFDDTFNLGVVGLDGVAIVTDGGADRVSGGAGNDTFNFGTTLTGADFVNGGAGLDVLNVGAAVAGYAGQTVALGLTDTGTAPDPIVTTGVTGIETLVLATGIVENTGAGITGTFNDYTVTVDSSAFETGNGSITIDGGALRDGEVLTVTGAGITGASQSLNIIGGAGDDVLTGGIGFDTINGGDGDDTIDGGAGDDVLTGGNGSDTITGGAGIDKIFLGNDGARDTVNVLVAGDAVVGATTVETVIGLDVGTRVVGANGAVSFDFTNADVINFGSDRLADGGSFLNGVVRGDSALQANLTAISNTFGETGLLQALQLVEQEVNSRGVSQDGVLAFRFGDHTYIGEINDTDASAGIREAFVNIVQVAGVTGVSQIVDLDATVGTGSFAFQI